MNTRGKKSQIKKKKKVIFEEESKGKTSFIQRPGGLYKRWEESGRKQKALGSYELQPVQD